MTSDRDRLLDTLGTLPAATLSAAATERLRARCHAALGQPPQIHRETRWPWFVLGASLMYLAAAVAQALKILNVT
jgi:hypothetical protein